MALPPFYRKAVKREQDELLEQRFNALEQFLEELPGLLSVEVRGSSAAATQQLRFPEGLIVEGDDEALIVSLEADATTLDPSIAYQVIDTTPGPQARRMPAAASAEGALHLKNIGPNTLYLYAASGEFIDGESVLVLPRQGSAVELVSDGIDQWRIFSVYLPGERLEPLMALLLLELRKITLHLASMSGEEVSDGDVEGE